MPADARPRPLAQFEDFVLDIRTGELCKADGKAIRIPEQSFQILTMLLERPGEVVGREEIRKRLWPNNTVVEFEHSISAAMNRLRQALGDNAAEPRFVETLARRGYRWMQSVEWVDAGPPTAVKVKAAASESFAATLIGRRVSHYRVLEVLGGGGMGIVFKAEDIKLGRRVALKFLPEELIQDQHARERFEREARAASALNHPNICTIHEIEEHDGQPFIVMELLEGKTLRELIGGDVVTAPLPMGKVLDFATQITEGLDAAHQKGIIHRDIKPSNIFITHRGEAKILDFGVAKLLEFDGLAESEAGGDPTGNTQSSEVPKLQSIHLTRTGTALGTEGYMSPEQVRGEKLDARTDLFSFGLVLYEMATCQRAFSGDTAPVLHEAILHQYPVPPKQINPGLPSGLERIIGKALEKDRQLRYQHAEEIRDDLKRMASKTLRPARRDSLKPTSRNRWLIVGTGVFVFLIVVGGFLWLKRQEPPLQPPLSQRQLTTNSSENPVSAGAISPDGKFVAYADLLGIHIKLIATGETHTIPQPESLKGTQVNWGIINGWAPDGTRLIANATPPGRQPSIWIAPVMGGAAHKIRDDAFAGAISRDGSWLAFIADPGEIGYREMWLMRPDGTDAHKVFEGDANSGFLGAEWSPDSQRLSFEWGQRIGGKIDWNMVSRDLKGGPAVIAIPGGIEDWSWSPDGRMIYSLDESNSGGCNFWAVRLARRTGQPMGPPQRLTNWAGFRMDNPSVTADGKRLAYRRWAPQGSVYIADFEDNEMHITPPKRLTLNEGLSYPASWTIDNKAVIFGSYRDNRWRIYKQAVNEDTADAIETGTDEDVVDARLSPDGAWIFYIVVPKTKNPSPLYKLVGVPIAGGSPRLVMSASIYDEPRCSRRPATICAIAEQTPDRKQLIFTAFDINGRIRELTRINTEPNSFTQYIWDLSPDGTRIAILKSSESLIRILSWRDGSSKDVTVKNGSPLESLNWTADGQAFFASSYTKEGLVLLRLDQQGRTHVVWEQKGSIAPWNSESLHWQGMPTAPLAIPSPDGRHLIIYEWSLSANMWMMENF